MVCLGNICRSPMAEGILKKKTGELGLAIHVDSAGTGGWHAGEHPDRRAIRTAKKFGIDISKSVARKFTIKDFEDFDRIVVMDLANLRDVQSMARTEADMQKIQMLLEPGNGGIAREVPDPWYGGEDGFIEVFQLMDSACDALVKSLMS